MIDALRQNVETEIDVLREISNNMRRLDYASPSERKLLMASVESLRASLKLINNSIPSLLNEITVTKRLPQKPRETGLESVEIKRLDTTIHVTLKKEDREIFLKQVRIGDQLIRKLKKRTLVIEEKPEEFKAARGYLKLANLWFLGLAQRYINRGYFKSLAIGLRKANIDVLYASYIALIFLTTVIAFVLSVIFVAFLLFFRIEISYPFISTYDGNVLYRFLQTFWLSIIVPVLVFFAVYYYPTTERDSLEKKIDQELPFAVIHMSAISGSGIEPSQIFKIIGISTEYPYLRKEIRKILNQINLYGYDLVNALNNVSKTTPSAKLAELFGGLSTTITTGGNLKDFFEKRAESLLVTYRLEREKYTRIAETLMDIYVSLVIAAPMILMILLVLISVSNFSVGFTTTQLTAIVIAIVALLNIMFIGLIHIKQPLY